MGQSTRVFHTLEPWYDSQSRVLILGTLPSPKSRESGCYYGHPQNRFWKTIAAVFEEAVPLSVEERRAFTAKHHIALWDVLASCEITGAQDSTITDPQPNDIAWLIQQAPIKRIYTTGTKAKALYDRWMYPQIEMDAHPLPSTSPANRRWYSDEALLQAYRCIRL